MTEWRKSPYSGGLNDDACVELADLGGRIGVRDSKDPGRGRLELEARAFVGLLEGLRDQSANRSM
ncbi:DUF397 domain-containing protein [Yinghuangia sp. YIM S09857]|uniref:DUF397 domain-containing protein n=1 Tax=Yinghuangia sp. YIM S09857 TaxID=3436929 RepID=UPI003F533910